MSDNKSFNQFVTLNENDLADPFEVIERFCEFDYLFDARKEIYELFSAAMGSQDWKGDTPLDKANRMFRLKLIIQIVETVYLLDHLRSTKRLQYSIRPEK